MADERRGTGNMMEAFDAAIDRITERLKHRNPSDEEKDAARVAATMLSTYTRMAQTEGNQQAVGVMLAREMAKDKDEFRRYIVATQPDHPILKKLKA